MSEDEDCFDDEYWEYYESPNDGAAARADDLAEHAIHSPVWVDIDPNFEMEEFWSDWENYSDDYYDGDTRKSTNVEGNGVIGSPKLGGKRKRAAGDVNRQKKRKREEANLNTPIGDPLDTSAAGAGMAAPIVIWRSKGSPEKPPALSVEETEKVAVLKDWRERFQNTSHADCGEEVRTKPAVKESKSTQALARKSARLRSRPLAKGITRGTIDFSAENGALPCELSVAQLQGKVSDETTSRRPNSTVKARTTTDSKMANATIGSAKSASGAGQKRKAPDPKEENGRKSKRKILSNRKKPRSRAASGSSKTTCSESGNHL
ncbi:MAG: hypothetical protein M1839_006682 [Geoglossum umbratile]|nr:MAG: hypothetical protein M1839_006682 [Geoglossum umbratile]